MRRRRRASDKREFARPILGLLALGLIWGAHQLGFFDLIGQALLSPVASKWQPER